ncbi:MAG TPA: ComEC/Rec2 family competence protein [Planktothrix sp.]|jgi:ComEC/Rec2-related protein
MQVLPLRYPVLVVLISLLALAGDAISLWHLPDALLFAPAAVIAFLWWIPQWQLPRWLIRLAAGKPLRWLPGWRSQAGILCSIALSFVTFLSFSYCRLRTLSSDFSQYLGKAVVVRGTVVEDGTIADDCRYFTISAGDLLFPRHRSVSVKIKVIVPAEPQSIFVASGMTGSFALKVCPSNSFNREQRGGAFTAYCTQVWLDKVGPASVAVTGANRFAAVCTSWRATLVEMHEKNLGHDLGDLLSSMVLGDKAVKLDDAIVQAFRNVGLSHVLAASGFNLTVVTAMTYFVCRLVVPSRLIVHLLCLLNVICYVGLAGASASVMRAAIMCAILLAIGLSGARAHLLSVLALALLISIAQDPSCTADIGLQLSYVATAALIFAGKPLCRLVAFASHAVARWLSETMAVVLLSQSAVLPIQLSCFAQIGLMFIPANLAVTPVLAPVTIIGFASSFIYLAAGGSPVMQMVAAPLCYLIDLVAVWPLKMMLSSVNFLASFDQAILKLGAPSVLSVCMYVMAWFFLACAIKAARWRVVALLLYLVALGALLWRPPVTRPLLVCFDQGVVCVSETRESYFYPAAGRKLTRAIGKWCLSQGFHLQGQSSTAGVITKETHFYFWDESGQIGRADTSRSQVPGCQTVLVAICSGKHHLQAQALKNCLRTMHPDYVVLIGKNVRYQSRLLSLDEQTTEASENADQLPFAIALASDSLQAATGCMHR